MGCPQPVLEHFMALKIPEDLRRGYGYPQITREDKEMILGANMARLTGLDIEGEEKGARASGMTSFHSPAFLLRRGPELRT